VDNPSRPDSDPEVIAGVDLGSNSFHMVVGEFRHGQLIIIDRIRETVRLAEGLSPAGDLSPEARARAIDCLARFGERLRDMHAAKVRAAGTSTIRRAREDTGFMAEAEAALGHPIEIISGLEEARLIYEGVANSLPPSDGLRLVMDVGGGSTELILGQGLKPRALESVHLGCVTMTERFFGDGQITRDAFDKARVAARLELRPVKAFFRDADGIEAIGTSGTIRSAEYVASELGLTGPKGLTPAAVEQLIERLIEFGRIDKVSLAGLSDRRAQVWPGGLSILIELLSVLRVSELKVSDGALREGLLYSLLGRLQHIDARERTVRAMATRYNVDKRQAKRVAKTAGALLLQCASTWGLDGPLSASILEWAARLHEIGLDISHDGYQRHGAYIAANADLPGFPRAEQRFLAFLIGSQRHQVNMQFLGILPRGWRKPALRLTILLRLAVLLNRSRSPIEVPPVTISVDDDSLSLAFDPEWLDANPLTVADLEREVDYLREIGYALNVSSVTRAS
jgi:exopolyphosphatase/guanosine-5'-triphosphate,3'-diphosphate pyrophosphatase